MTFPADAKRPLRILVADDDAATGTLLQTFLEEEGHAVVAVPDGAAAIAEAHKSPFQLFILDVEMPGVDGLEACRYIKHHLENWVPIILVSANSDEQDQVTGMDMGAEHYVTKPISFPLLKAKLRSAQRLWSLYSDLQSKNAALERYLNQSQADNDLAADILQRIAGAGGDRSRHSQHLVRPAEGFSGDIIVSCYSLSQCYYCLVADATGHGLPAAITLLPAIDTFYRLVRQGYALGTLAYELNRRLREALPRDRFIAATLIMIDPRQQSLEVWNGGCPPALVLEPGGAGIHHRFPAQHPPLGVLEPDDFLETTTTAFFNETHTLVAYTDGITEARSPQGELFGGERLEQLLSAQPDAERIPVALRQALEGFTGSRDNADDQTLLLVPMAGLRRTAQSLEVSPSPLVCELFPGDDDAPLPASRWAFGFRLSGKAIRDTEVIPLVNHCLSEMGLPRSVAERAHLCATELINNAIDHGVLGLSSQVKEGPEGFETYFRSRQEKLAALDHGEIHVHAALRNRDGGQVLVMEVSDSGQGFAARQVALAGESHYGRGIALLRQLADELSYDRSGARALFEIAIDNRKRTELTRN